MKELYRFRQFLTEENLSKGKLLKENIDDNFKTYYEVWEDEFAPSSNGVFDFEDWDDGNKPGSKEDSHTWEVNYEEEDDYYAPIINNMLNYLKKNKTYIYQNDDGIDVEFSISKLPDSPNDYDAIDMNIYYSADDLEKYKNKFK